MNLEVNVTSKEVITPSSPTLSHQKSYQLSFLDQMMPSILMPIVLFYPPHDSLITKSERSKNLKKSLSKVLALFYPLAGRLVGNNYVNCNDKGVTYVEAQANLKLFDVITDPIPEELSKFLPCDPDDGKDLCLVVQATFFSCGGLALMVGISHKLADAFSIFMFVNSWAALTRGDDHIQSPKFESAIMFPPKDHVNESVGLENKEDLVTKRFVFSSEKISKLRDKYTKNMNDEGLIRVTRIEILSAFIWTRFLAATGAKDDSSKLHGLRVFVNIRPRAVPPLSEYHFGNLIMPAIITPSFEEDQDEVYSIMNKTRDAIHNYDGHSVSNLHQQMESLIEMKEQLEKTTEMELVKFMFSSICGFPLHKVNFGWGKPVWIGGANVTMKNLGIFTNSFSGSGIDAWVILKKEDMVKFEKDNELLEYASNENDTKFVSKM